MRLRPVLAVVLMTAGLAGCQSSSGDANRTGLTQRREQALATFHQIWPTLSGAADTGKTTQAVASGSYEQCADDGSTMAFAIDGFVPAAKAGTSEPVVAQLHELLTKAGWTAKAPQGDTQALRFVNGKQLASVYASGGRYALQVRSDCVAVTDAERKGLPPAETIAGTLAPATSSSATSSTTPSGF